MKNTYDTQRVTKAKYSLVFLGVVFETLLKKAYEQLRQRISKKQPEHDKGHRR